jgi:hypothetical protein
MTAATGDWPTGAAVRVVGGPWSGITGVIDAMSDSVARYENRIVRADPLPKGGAPDPQAVSAERWMPRTRLVVVRCADLAAK